MLVSFVIPAYNASETIFRCLDSIYKLPIEESIFEVIVIDDCSTDKTVELVKEYACGHSNLVLLCQPENRRQGAARNKGVVVAKGEYVSFVDSDDTVAEGIVSAICLAKEHQTDMTVFHYANANGQGQITFEKEHLSFMQGSLFSGIDFQNAHPYWCSGPVAYIYNKSFLDKVDYPFAEGVFYEDSDFVMVHLYYAKRMTYSRDLGYIVYYREGSTTHSMTHKNLSDYLLLGTRMLRFYEKIEQQDLQCADNVNGLVIKQFAEDVLEGACWNVTKSIKRLIKIGSIKEIRAFYDRVDCFISRQDLNSNPNIRKYYYNAWTMICMMYRHVATTICIILFPFYRVFSHFRVLFLVS